MLPLHASKMLDRITLDNDQKIGLGIVRRALEEPLRQIARNSGKEGAEVVARLNSEKNESIGYNAKKDSFEDLFKSGVIDPTKVIRCGLQNAASIAGMILNTEAIVAEYDDEKDEKSPLIVM